MNKRVVTFFAGVGLFVGAYVPIVFGWDPSGLNGISILGGLVGGLIGVWVGTKIKA